MMRARQIEGAAADWVVRLQSPEADETQWQMFDAWLEQSPRHQQAYDAALALNFELDQVAPQLRHELGGQPSFAPSRPHQGGRTSRATGWRFAPWIVGLAGGAVAATLLVAVAPWRPAPYTTYATGKGEHRTIVLADGSHIDLGAESRISVRLENKARRVTVEQSEAIFDVAKDAGRPFLISAGDETIRVVGTQFDVRRRQGRLAVTVARGLVEVAPATGQAVRLRPGQQLEHAEGTSLATVREVAPADVFGWRDGRLIYRDATLGQVTQDLNRYFAKPIRLSGQAANLRFSGVLILAPQDEMVRRLDALLPITATTTGDAIVLHSR